MPEKWLSSTCEKVTKYNLRIKSKPHACLQTMTKTPLKFPKNRYKTVGGVAPTRYPLSIRSCAHKVPTSIGGREDEEPKTKSLRFSSKRRGTINQKFQCKVVNIFLPMIFSICFGCSIDRLIEMVLLSTHNICFG